MSFENKVDAPDNGRFTQILKETLKGQPCSVYYPGIGGLEESIDYSSAFGVVEADVVHGVDLWDSTNVNENQKKEAFLKAHSQMIRWLSASNSERSLQVTESEVEWEASFNWRGKPRKFVVSKLNIDATTYIPPFDFNVIYSRRTYRLVTHLPAQVYAKAELLVDQEQLQAEGELVRDWLATNRKDFEVVKINEKYGDGKSTVARRIHYPV